MYAIIQRIILLALVCMVLFPSFAYADPMTTENMKQLSFPWHQLSDGTVCSSPAGSGSLSDGIPAPYNGIITAAAEKFGASGNLVASILYWENRGWPPVDKDWATSSAGAQGPMQFLPDTFAAYAVDGNNDGKKDINNIYDAIYSGANMVAQNGGKTGTPLGSLDKPLKPETLLRVAASYNWGGGNVQSAGENATLDDLPTETSDYLKAVYVLISSDFKQSPQSGSSPTPPASDAPSSTAQSSTCDASGGVPGSGSGKFTDNTSTTIPGADQAIARAQEIAKYSSAQLQSICDGSPNCYQRCERLAGVVWGHSSSGYSTANAHWFAAVAAGKAHPGDRNVPIGALLYYDTGSDSGHVATYLGNNLILSNDVGDSAGGRQGGAYIVDAKDMEGGKWNLAYRGWVNPVPW